MNKTILVVEDNERNMKLARDLLRHNGYEVIEAHTAESGIRLARDRQPDLVLMDIQLPGMDGFAALGALRADPATKALRIVAFTASVMKQDVDRILESGFDGYIAKPIAVKEFAGQVKGLIA